MSLYDRWDETLSSTQLSGLERHLKINETLRASNAMMEGLESALDRSRLEKKTYDTSDASTQIMVEQLLGSEFMAGSSIPQSGKTSITKMQGSGFPAGYSAWCGICGKFFLTKLLMDQHQCHGSL